MKENDITGSGKDYYKHMSPRQYREKINTPSGNPEYFRRFVYPLIERTKKRFGSPVRVLDIACGPANELDFLQDNPDVRIIATDISPQILPHVKEKLGPTASVFASDASFPAFREDIAEAGIMVNAVIYVPDKMLEAMYRGLKPGGQCVVNFKVTNEFQNKKFFDYVTARGAKVFLNKKLILGTKTGKKSFNVTIIDCTEMVNENGTPDLARRQLGQQINFQTLEAVRELIASSGFVEIEHKQFEFTSPIADSTTEVFVLEKPLNA